MLQLHLSDQQFYCLLQWLILEVWQYSPFKWFDYMHDDMCLTFAITFSASSHASGAMCITKPSAAMILTVCNMDIIAVAVYFGNKFIQPVTFQCQKMIENENIYQCLLGLIQHVNSVAPSDTTWWHRSGSTLVQVMACCLMTPNQYLTHCWLIINKFQWYWIILRAILQDTSATSSWN